MAIRGKIIDNPTDGSRYMIKWPYIASIKAAGLRSSAVGRLGLNGWVPSSRIEDTRLIPARCADLTSPTVPCGYIPTHAALVFPLPIVAAPPTRPGSQADIRAGASLPLVQWQVNHVVASHKGNGNENHD